MTNTAEPKGTVPPQWGRRHHHRCTECHKWSSCDGAACVIPTPETFHEGNPVAQPGPCGPCAAGTSTVMRARAAVSPAAPLDAIPEAMREGVEREAQDARSAAWHEAWTSFKGDDREARKRAATLASAQAYADVLARHVVAARVAATGPAILTYDEKTAGTSP